MIDSLNRLTLPTYIPSANSDCRREIIALVAATLPSARSSRPPLPTLISKRGPIAHLLQPYDSTLLSTKSKLSLAPANNLHRKSLRC